MQVNMTTRACSDYIDNYLKGALDDYKRAVSADRRRFKQDHLKDFEADFFARIEHEVKTVRDLIESGVGGMIQYHGDWNGKWMQNYDQPSSLALRWAASEVALFNMQLLDSKPRFATTFKEWYEDKPSLVLFASALGGAAALATLKADYDVVATLMD